ncbi:MAG TPA: adenylate/guanylate cyclase domain-containing protein [Planctomycetota bacterium]|nr:adenylate/guanylate cyclase domain-containing protein [Planctomycetota bacterium]
MTEQPAPSVHEERKVVTVLFCDLVGFTSASEAADPEDVRSRIRPYHARLRLEIERYGGTVEKFIGDAVMAVFGAPVAHEDDAERAVRAGLRILEAIEELNADDPALSLQVRIGINTGEAVVALGARPEEGEGIVTGDVVNTASRLQGAAPVNAIACSEQTYRATERVFDYEELEPVQVKGKAEPLALFRPLAARARFGSDVTRTHATPLVGRELEMPLLIGTFERSAQQRSCQLVTIVGEPGVGKSRLCAELFGHIEERPGLVRWRQGRCLPYGEGIAFWALGEIVKAECGILESDSPEEAKGKLERALPAGDPDGLWLESRLQPLVGAGGEPASQEESFTAWRRCIESWAEGRETILVFEDLHWADQALLSFLERLADWSEDVPLLLLCTARPELYEQHPTFGANARNAQRINLAPLTEAETARLITSLLERTVLPAETQQVLLERAGGNPLYAEEFVRLLADRGELRKAVDEVPDSVLALIAARLDTLSQERKSLLQDAAVLGKVFWAGALAEIGARDPREIEQALHELSRKELVRPARTSSMEGEAEYGFWHLLVRDVCYGQIPRVARAARHRAAAAWIERRAGERVEDLADVLAHHYLTALELARAAGQTEETEELEASARRYLALAGERALALDVERAEQSLAKALELIPAGHRERPSLLERWASTVQQLGRLREARAALEEAIVLYREQGDSVAAGRALTALPIVLANLGDPHREAPLTEAIALLEAQPPGPELVAAYGELAGLKLVFLSDYPEVIKAADRALQLAAELGLPEPARARGFRGSARASLGDREGLDDLRRALALSVERGESRDAGIFHANLSEALSYYDGPEAALAVAREGVEFTGRRGISEVRLHLGAQILGYLADAGRPTEALAESKPLAVQLEAAGAIARIGVLCVQLRLLAERGEPEPVAGDAERLAAAARDTAEAQQISNGFAAAARMLLSRGKHDEARELLLELEQPGIRGKVNIATNLPELTRCARAVGDTALARRFVEAVEPLTPIHEHGLCAAGAHLAEAAGEPAQASALFAEAAERWREFGNVPERAYALLGQGRCLAALGKPDAEKPLREARELFASMGYKPALAETEALLGDGEAAAV